MNKHTATLPDGQIVTRNSATRTYSHVIAFAVSYAWMRRTENDSIEYAELMLASALADTISTSFRGEERTPAYWEARLAEAKARLEELAGPAASDTHHWIARGWAGTAALAEAQVRGYRNHLYTAEAIPAEIA